MKKRKVLFLLPIAALILSGCTIQEGWETVSGFFTNSVYEPVKGWVENLLGIKHEQKKEDKKDDQGDKEPDVAGDDVPVEVEDIVIGSIENPISIADFQTQLDALIDYAAVEENKTEVDSSHLFYVKGKVTGSTALNEYKEINFLNMVDCDDSSKQVTGYWTVVDSSITEDFSAKDSLKGREVVVKGYGGLYKKVKNNQETKTYELMKKDNDHKSTLVKVYEAQTKTEPEKLNKTLAEIIQCEPTKSQAYISKGKIKSWATNQGGPSNDKTKYGNLIITDGTNDVFVYGASGVATDLAWDEVAGEYKMTNSAEFLTNDLTKDLKPGDEVNFWGTYYKYYEKYEMDMIITSKIDAEVESVTLSKHSIELEVGKMDTLTVEVTPENADQEVTWDVVQTAEFISFKDGKITALAEGTATITATSVADPTKSDSCTVTVKAATKQLTSVTLSGTPKSAYTEGEKYSKEGLVLTANYSDQSTEDVTEFAEWEISKETAELNDDKITITASYQNLSDSMIVPVTVSARVNLGGLEDGGKYFIVSSYDNNEYYLKGFDSADKACADSALLWPGDEHTPVSDADAWTFTAGEAADQWTIKNKSGNTLFSIKDNNGLRTGESDHVWQVEDKGEDGLKLYNTAHVNEKGMYLTCYNGANFRTYSASSQSGDYPRPESQSTIKFVKYVEKTLDSIAVTANPTKTSYFVGEAFDPTGLEVTAHYTYEGGTEDVVLANSDYTLDFSGTFAASDVGTKAITVSYGQKTASFNVTVEQKQATLSSVVIEGTPKTAYLVGDNYSREGLTAKAVYSDNSEIDVTENATWAISKEKAEAGDTKITITATYENVVGEREVSVTVATPVSVSFDATAQGYTNQQEITSATAGDFTIAFDKGTNSNAPKYYTSGTAIRCYGGNTIAISNSSNHTIVGVTITFGSSDGSNAISADSGTYKDGKWEGSASSVTFTIGGTTGNRRVAGITISYIA